MPNVLYYIGSHLRLPHSKHHAAAARLRAALEEKTLPERRQEVLERTLTERQHELADLSFADLVKIWDWHPTFEESSGDLIKLKPLQDYSLDEDTLFELLADDIEDGGVIELENAECRYREFFWHGQVIEQTAEYSYAPVEPQEVSINTALARATTHQEAQAAREKGGEHGSLFSQPVRVLAVAFVPDYKLGPDSGRQYALVQLGQCFYPLIFCNPDMDDPDRAHLVGRPVELLERRLFPDVEGCESNEHGHLFWRTEEVALAWFIEHYTQRFPGFLISLEVLDHIPEGPARSIWVQRSDVRWAWEASHYIEEEWRNRKFADGIREIIQDALQTYAYQRGVPDTTVLFATSREQLVSILKALGRPSPSSEHSEAER